MPWNRTVHGPVAVRAWQEGATVNNQWFSKVAIWVVMALVLFAVFKQFDRSVASSEMVAYSEFLEMVRDKRIKQVDPPGGRRRQHRDPCQDHRRQAHPKHRDLPRPRSRG